MPEERGDLYIRTRSDRDLFNLRCMKAKNRTQEQLIQELLFADDSALVTHSLQAMQDLLTAFAEASKRFGLTINIKKTEVLFQDTHNAKLNPREVLLNGTPLAEVVHLLGKYHLQQWNYRRRNIEHNSICSVSLRETEKPSVGPERNSSENQDESLQSNCNSNASIQLGDLDSLQMPHKET